MENKFSDMKIMENKTQEDDIVRIVNDILACDALTRENLADDLGEYGLDSLTMIMLVSELERRFKCLIPDSKMVYSKMNTMEKIFDLMEEVLGNV